MTGTRMTAIAIRDGKGPADALHPVQAPYPDPAAGEVVIRVRAAGVNRPDQRVRPTRWGSKSQAMS